MKISSLQGRRGVSRVREVYHGQSINLLYRSWQPDRTTRTNFTGTQMTAAIADEDGGQIIQPVALVRNDTEGEVRLIVTQAQIAELEVKKRYLFDFVTIDNAGKAVVRLREYWEIGAGAVI